MLLLHKFLFEYEKGYRPDHINHNGLDNRKSNVRIAKIYNNNSHRQCKNSNNKSGYRNVFWDKHAGKWCVNLSVNYKRIQIGYFDDLQDAAKAADEARKKYYGDFSGEPQ